jgi:hypothetical protein
MTKLTTEQRHELPDSDFAYIDHEGNRHLPIENAEHVRDALARWPRTRFDSEAGKEEARTNILAAAKTFGIEVSLTDKTARNEHD